MLVTKKKHRKGNVMEENEQDILDNPYGNKAIKRLNDYARHRLQNYQEPQRKGRLRGEKIGFSREKYYAAVLTILYPNCLSIKEIANLAGVSIGVYRTWRTEDDFLQEVENESAQLGEFLGQELVRLIRNDNEDKIINGIRIIPYFNNTVLNSATSYVESKLDHENVMIIKLFLSRCVYEWQLSWAKNKKEAKKIERSNLENTKNIINYTIDVLSDSETHQWIDEDKLEEMRHALKKIISHSLDTLAR